MLFKILFFGLAAILPIIFYFLANNFIQTIISHNFGNVLFVLITSLYYLYIWLFIFAVFVDYYLDVWIVTNHRILNIEQKGLFHRVISEQKLYRIQDVTSELKGILPTLFNYGTVHIQTAAEKSRFIFKQVPDPRHVSKKVIMMSEQSKKFKRIMEEKEEITT